MSEKRTVPQRLKGAGKTWLIAVVGGFLGLITAFVFMIIGAVSLAVEEYNND